MILLGRLNSWFYRRIFPKFRPNDRKRREGEKRTSIRIEQETKEFGKIPPLAREKNPRSKVGLVARVRKVKGRKVQQSWPINVSPSPGYIRTRTTVEVNVIRNNFISSLCISSRPNPRTCLILFSRNRIFVVAPTRAARRK